MTSPEMNENNALAPAAENTHHDVGIVGLWFGLNYGSILTYYALYEVVRSMGYSAMMVNKPEVLWRPKYADRETVANRFIYKYCGEENVSKCYHSSVDYKILNQSCDTFIVGSDVVWNYQICGHDAGQFFFLDFVNDNKKKIAMASSFGSGYDAPDEERIRSEHYLKKFDYIGVRENEAVNICSEVFHTGSDKIMDPVFLIDRKIYHNLADNAAMKENDVKYVSSYFLGPGAEKAELLKKIANILGAELRCLPNPNNPNNFTNKTGLPAIENPSVEDWLNYFKHTQCYIGDSFHGLCFSIIFERPFVVIVNRGQSLARFRTLLKTIGYENRMINIDDDDTSEEVITQRINDILAQEIDYEKVNKIIFDQASVSYEWLKNAIESKKTPVESASRQDMTVRNPQAGDIDPATVAEVPENICTGCSACANVCPADAITMKPNADGFIMPCVDNEKCVHCKKCSNTCPAIHTLLDNSVSPEIYVALAEENVREQSSSGGMFTVAAEKILDLGGYVCGAAFDYDGLQAVHKITNTKEGLEELRTSKYTQSNINLLYRDVKKLLEEDKPVLFTGTPCQVAGLNAYLNKDYENLYTIDILCHGVPSQQLIEKYITEISQLPEVCSGDTPPKPTKIYFRDKERHGWRSSTFIRIEFDNGAVYEGSLKGNDPFEKAFHEKLALRKSCANCLFCAFPRQGDISIGDFWGITKYAPSYDDKKGTSMVLINNIHGKQLFESMTPAMNKYRRMKIPTADIKKNRVRAVYPASPKRPRFMELNKNRSLTQSVKMTIDDHFDVGLVVNFYAVNFGGAMTHYALYHVLEDMGYSTLMIERPKTSKNLTKVLEAYDDIHLAPLFPDYAVAKSYDNKDQMRDQLNKKCDMFVVGSDKLFNYILYTALDKYTSLDWVEDTKKKIAYSASFGRTLGDPKVHSELSYFLRKFDHFSCREDSGVETAKEVYGVEKDIEWVLDPVFMCDQKHYQTLIDRCNRTLPKKYVSAYILDPTEDKQKIVRHFKDKLSADCEVFSEYLRPQSYYEALGDLYKGPLKTEERLQSIANCDYFVTDSFHGMCFAIIMKKQFVAIVNERRGASRFYSIAKMLHLEDRLIHSIDELDDPKFNKKINYNKVHKIIDTEKERCMNWLSNALAAPKTATLSDYDIMRKLITEQDQKITALQQLIVNMTANISTNLEDKTDLLDYLDSLKAQTAGNIIVVSVKDTPGLALDSFVASRLNHLGLTTNLEAQHAHSYIGIINGGKVIFEKLGQNDEPTVYSSKVGKNTLYVTSRTYKNGNEAIIKINGKNYSVNSRGLNIVVFNKTMGKAVDSVCFDTHVNGFDCTRTK